MSDGWMALQSVPPGGITLTLEDHPLWRELLEEFFPCRMITPIRAEVFILPQEDGVLFRGSFTGEAVLSCIRCTEDCVVRLAERFDAFEPFPDEAEAVPGKRARRGAYPAASPRESAETDELPDEAVIHRSLHGIAINPAALVWEEFSLALPVAPLCREDCKGLCPICGGNKNTDACACSAERGDPRLAVLRGLTLSEK